MLATTAVMLPIIHSINTSYNNMVCASYAKQTPLFLYRSILIHTMLLLDFKYFEPYINGEFSSSQEGSS